MLAPPRNQVRKLAMLDYFEEEEEEEEEQQQEASAQVAITNNGQRNHPTALPSCVLFAAKERVQGTRCDGDLCVVLCFTEYHKLNL